MSELLEWMKNVYKSAKENQFEWKPIYPNNMPCNPQNGIYVDMFFEREGKYTYLKYSIQYQSRCDKDGLSHPEEGPQFYILHELRENDIEEKFDIPEPSNDFRWDNHLANLVNNYGRFRYAFNDEETAKSVVSHELLSLIYPYGYILSVEEVKEWNSFVEDYEKKH